jgi:hypothetical protein
VKPPIRIEKRKAEVKEGELLTKKPRPQPREGSSGALLAQVQSLNFATPRPQIWFKVAPPKVEKKAPSPSRI